MRRVLLSGTEVHVSRLSFGTASLHHIPTTRLRGDLLSAAFEHGFTHFDTSPYYGFGLAEVELGQFLRGRRGRVTIATKVGIYPPRGASPSTFAVWARKVGGAIVPGISRPIIDWSLAAAERSLATSLTRLGADQIDLLLLHEPSLELVPSEVFLEWLQKEKSRGRIAAWGLAGEARSMDSWLGGHPLGQVLQVRDSLHRREADVVLGSGRDLQITYGYLAPMGRVGATTATSLLASALQRNARGSVLVSTRRIARISELAAVAEMA